MRKLLPFSALAFSLAALSAAQADDEKNPGKADAAKLEGTYTIVGGEDEGRKVDPSRYQGSIVKITKTRFIGTDKDRKEFFAADYTIDTSKKPWGVTMKSTSPKEHETRGLIKKEGDTVTIVYALPGGEPPTEFKTKEKQHLFVLKPVRDTKPRDR